MVSEPAVLPWTILKVLSWSEGYFNSLDIDSARLTAELLLCHCLGIKRLDLYLQYDRPLQKNELALYKELIKRRAKREPVAYITGSKGFFLSELLITPEVLIPRPDTETLVETALDLLKKAESKKVLELGVGSGAVIISLAKADVNCSYVGVDISPGAVKVAVENGEKAACKNVVFVAGSWFSCFKKIELFDLIVSNPPYIPSLDIDSLQPEISEYEPRLALDGGEDGLDCVREIIETASFYLKPGGVLLMETGSDQKNGVKEIADRALVYDSLEYVKDYAGHDRVAKLKKR